MKYIVPEYYKQFNCKCGECRHSCCEGWPVRISMKEYYRLLGINCSAKLRAKLDCALKVCPKPSNECYAQISSDWRGTCILHREDGLCALHKELGESYLPEVCRLYPRNTKRHDEKCECSCSNSCEKVIELLMNIDGPLQFDEIALSAEPEFEFYIPSSKYEFCKKSVSIIQDRCMPLNERFVSLGNYLNGTSIIPKRPNDLNLAFQVLHTFISYFESSSNICEYCQISQSYFGIDGTEKLSEKDLITITDKYIAAADHLDYILPDWQILFEQLIVNHMFYNNFPFTLSQENISDAYLSLVIMYSFLRFNILGYMCDKTNPEYIIDFLAAMFRVIEHSDFNYIAVNLFKKEHFPYHNCIEQLIYV